MTEKYDVIVVGAGNAGLSAAATVAGGGLKTLVIEKNGLPGGCATSFRRGRFEFETSLHEMCNIGTEENPGSIRRLFGQYGARVNWVTEDTLFRVIADGAEGYDIRLRAGKENFLADMESAVPGCRESVEAVFEYIGKIDGALSYLSAGKPDINVLANEHADFLRMASHSVDDCLEALNVPKKAADLLKTYWPYLGAPTNELDFVHYGSMLSRYVIGRPAVPSQTSHEISMAMESAVRGAGGRFLYNTAVTKLLFDGDKLCGVTAGGDNYYADTVVLNCSPTSAYTGVIEKERVPERAVKIANYKTNGMLFFTVYLGLNRTAAELGIDDYTVFLYGGPDAVEQFGSCGDINNSFVIANCLNTLLPGSSPAGTSTLFLTTMFTKDAWETALSAEDYRELKNRVAERMINRYEKQTGITVRPYIEEIAVAAPPTFARYLGTPNGTPYGYRATRTDTIVTRAMNKNSERFIKGLYFVGAHAENSDGYSSAFSNGHSAGVKILKEAANGGA